MSFNLQYMTVAAIACICSAASVALLTKSLRRLGKCDAPNDRSSHIVPTPAGGGVGIAIGLAVALTSAVLLFGMTAPPWAILLGAATMVAVGAMDDWNGGLANTKRLALQAAAAGLVVYAAGPIEALPLPPPIDFTLGWLGYPLSLFWIVGVANVYNFLDGIDGFAGAQGLLAGIALVILPLDSTFALVGWVLAGACLGFLAHNWRPARIFMGDSGSVAIGFLLGAMPFAAAGADRGTIVFWTALALWFFLADGAYTLLRRMVRGERFWQPHRTHLYQRLVRTGLRHDQVVIRIGLGALALILATAAYVRNRGEDAGWPLLLAAICGFVLYLNWTRRRESAKVPKPLGLGYEPIRAGSTGALQRES